MNRRSAIVLSLFLAGCTQSPDVAEPNNTPLPEGVTKVTLKVPGMT